VPLHQPEGSDVPRTGRRPGNQDTREAILGAAREAFAERGYDGASIRLIAGAAGVDPALVHHYFGTKDQLFLDAVQAPIDPGKIIPQALAGDRADVGERLVRTVLSVWDSPAGGAAAGMLRSAVGNDLIAKMLRELIMQRIFRRISKVLDLDPVEAPIRLGLVASPIGGRIMVRYILRVEPMASLPPEAIVTLIGPTIQGYLDAPLPALPKARPGKR
jgi:AcrR family transcriptional regulator